MEKIDDIIREYMDGEPSIVYFQEGHVEFEDKNIFAYKIGLAKLDDLVYVSVDGDDYDPESSLLADIEEYVEESISSDQASLNSDPDGFKNQSDYENWRFG